ncbi:MAG: PAS domain S-box protein, partial [Ignavibacteria bacterium]|nr:PAS domain S-box protein [Ignavibacteria bacterium]
AVDMYGYSQREFKDLPIQVLRPPELREELEPFLKEMGSSADGLVYETIHMKKNGRKFPVEISAKLIVIENEILIVGIFRNIEERKRAERVVQESEMKFRSLFENANDAIFLLKDYRFTDCNSKALQLFEATKEEVCGKTPADFSPEFQINGELSKEQFKMKIDEAINGSTGLFEWRYRSLKGKTIDCEVSLSALEINREKYIQAIVRDVTEKKHQLNQMLKLTEAVQNTAEMLIITDVEGHIDYANPAFEKTTGYKLEEIRGLKPNILKSGFHTQEFYKDLWDTILRGESWQGIMFNKKKSGEIYTEEIVISPIKDDKQKIISFVAIKRDVTDRIRAEEELTKAKVKAEVSDRIKSNFLSMMSHEVRTPLNVILGFIDIIRVSIPKDVFPEKEHFFETIQRNSKRLMNLIDDMIDISRIESNEMKLNFEAKNVQSMLMNITSDYELDIKAKGLKLIEEYDDEPIYINVDELRFSQIMTNLITNAIKFTLKGEIKVSAHRRENEVQISVADTGIGIPDEFKPHLFEFFRQAEEGYKRNYEGAGLGLAISAKLVKLMNGKIEVESQLNKGSTFTITFQVYESISKISDKISAEISAEIKPKTFSTPPSILIVEDNEDNKYFIEVILDKLGLTHTTVESANEALDLMNKQKFDLVLMDISLLGDINGEQALDLIRANVAYNDIPVVAMTAYALPSDREKFIKRGFSDYMAKPFTIEQLTNILFRLLRGN